MICFASFAVKLTVFENYPKVSFYKIASEASYVYLQTFDFEFWRQNSKVTFLNTVLSSFINFFMKNMGPDSNDFD